jgi:hypothetical protein
MEYWDGATHQLFSNLADNLTQEYLYKAVDGESCQDEVHQDSGWLDWNGSTSNLQDLYPLEPLHGNKKALTREMSQLIRTKPATHSAAQGLTVVYSANIGTESSSAFSSAPLTYFEPEVTSVVVPADFQAAATS